MADDLPDDWFRPRPDGASSTPATRAGGENASADGSSGGPADSAADGTADTEGDERYTDQFKPQFSQQPSRREAPARPAPATKPASIPVVAAAPARDGAASVETAASSRTSARPVRVRRSWLGRHPVLATLLVIALALVVGLSAGQLLRQRGDRVAPTVSTTAGDGASQPSASQPSASQPSASQPSASDDTSTSSASPSTPVKPWDGATAPLAAKGVSATCTADPARDNNGKLVAYGADLVLDDDPATAWRCNGEAKGQKLTFTFPAGATLVGVGVINGYAKTIDGEALYEQYRRVLAVEWHLPDGSWFSQSLADNNTTLQQVSIPPVTIDGPVVMTLITTSPPGRLDLPTRDAVLISQVKFFTQG